MGIRSEIIGTIQEHIRTHQGQEPTKLFLTAEDELRLRSMSLDEAGGPVSGNVREDWKTFDGKTVVWDAEFRHCE